MSSVTAQLHADIAEAPLEIQREVLDFLTFLRARAAQAPADQDGLLPLAESAWAADWASPEEDAAWADL